MELNKKIAQIQIFPEPDRKIRITTTMPVWKRAGEDGKIYVSLPLLGMETYAENESEVEEAVGEALFCFYDSADKKGKGIPKELEMLGWQIKTPTKIRFKSRNQTFNLPKDRPALQNVMQTGTSINQSVLVGV